MSYATSVITRPHHLTQSASEAKKDESDRLVSPADRQEDQFIEATLRPTKLEEYVGQPRIKQNLRILISAARGRSEQLDHILLHGAPGLGKTTLANIIAREMGVNIRTTSGPAIERAGDLGAILTNLQDHDILFIDEIHRLNKMIEEVLYPAMEDFALDLVVGKGPAARTLRLDLPKFTIIGATTRAGALSSPLRDRFGAAYRLEFYTEEEITAILLRSAAILRMPIDPAAATLIASRSRKTPRIANRLLKRVRDFAQVDGKSVIDIGAVDQALELLDIDARGLDRADRLILETAITRFGGGPVGLQALASATNEEIETIEDVIEPYLLQEGYLIRTPRGRQVTDLAYRHLGMHSQASLLSMVDSGDNAGATH